MELGIFGLLLFVYGPQITAYKNGRTEIIKR